MTNMKCNRIRITLYDKLSSLRSIKGKSPQQLKLSDINANHFFRLGIGIIPPLWLISNFHAYDKNGGGIESMKYMHIEEIDKPSTLSYKSKENFN